MAGAAVFCKKDLHSFAQEKVSDPVRCKPLVVYKMLTSDVQKRLLNVLVTRYHGLHSALQRYDHLVYNEARKNKVRELQREIKEVETLIEAFKDKVFISVG